MIPDANDLSRTNYDKGRRHNPRWRRIIIHPSIRVDGGESIQQRAGNELQNAGPDWLLEHSELAIFRPGI